MDLEIRVRNDVGDAPQVRAMIAAEVSALGLAGARVSDERSVGTLGPHEIVHIFQLFLASLPVAAEHAALTASLHMLLTKFFEWAKSHRAEGKARAARVDVPLVVVKFVNQAVDETTSQAQLHYFAEMIARELLRAQKDRMAEEPKVDRLITEEPPHNTPA